MRTRSLYGPGPGRPPGEGGSTSTRSDGSSPVRRPALVRQSIARELNDTGTSSPNGRGWSRQTVSLILRNPVYKGERYGVKGGPPAIVTRPNLERCAAGLMCRALRRSVDLVRDGSAIAGNNHGEWSDHDRSW